MEYHVVPIKGTQMLSPIKEQVIAANENFGWTVQQSLSDFQNEQSEYYCLVEKENLLGYLGLHRFLDEASINMVYIAPPNRQRGLALSLVIFTIDQLAARGVKHLFLEVRVSNQAAINLYSKAGFIAITQRKNYYNHPVEDALIMQKQVMKEG